MAGSEFAKRQLMKQGWTEGSGLGKQEDGRSEPIKVSLKMDKSGVGHDPGKEFTDHWWLRVFNEAAQKIGKKQDDFISNDDGELKQKKMSENKNNLYKGFVKSATLTNGIEEKNTHSDSSSEDSTGQDDNTSLPTLNDIHNFCGGATGHKAARFGIKMSGKLARVAEHDKMFEEKLEKEKLSTSVSKTDCISNRSLLNTVEQKPSVTSNRSLSDGDMLCGTNGDNRRKKKKHKKKIQSEDANSGSKSLTEEVNCGPDEIINDLLSEENRIKRKHRKKKNIADNDLVEDTVIEWSQNNETHQDAKHKKKQKRRHVMAEDSVCENDMRDKKSKKKKNKTEKRICTDELLQKYDSNDVKKKKRKKHKE